MLSRLMTRREQTILLVLGASMLLGAVTLWFHHGPEKETVNQPSAYVRAPKKQATAAAKSRNGLPKQKPAVETLPASVEAATAKPAETAVVVAAMGAVHREGTYRMLPGDRVADLLQRAGGALETADLSGLELAAPLADATTLSVPFANETEPVPNPQQYRRGPQPASLSGGTPTLPSAPLAKGVALVNLNTATQAELEALPGVGEKTAQAITAGRPYASVDGLLDVKGIGPKKLEQLRPFVTAR